MILNFLFYAAVFIGIVIFIVWAVRQMGSGKAGQTGWNAESTPEELLKARYARGEISREEYLATLDDLKQ